MVNTNTAAVLPLRKQHNLLLGRQVVLVDIENVVGGAVLTTEAATWARHQIENVLELRDDAQVIIGSSRVSLLNSALAWPNKQYVSKAGPNGADLVLLDEIDSLRTHRYDEVIVVSGDGIFADAIAALAQAGKPVTVVAHFGRCSRRLRLAAGRTIYLQREHNRDIASGVA